tara:strand:+ start:21510 stop:21872 length:363 start_codon:yes stop_codon:yes gene_type:complete
MRLVYHDVLEELQGLIDQCKKDSRVSHIALTPSELKACLAHANAAQVFPNYLNEREKQLVHVRQQMDRLKPKINDDSISSDEKQPFFDRMDELEARESELLNKYPHSLREGNIVFKVSMR